MSIVKVDAIQNTSGVEVYTTKAWVNFSQVGTQTIAGSGNVSSITDLGTGDTRVALISAMPNTNYVCSGATSWDVSANVRDSGEGHFRPYAITTSTVSMVTDFHVYNIAYIERDFEYVGLLIVN